MTWTQMLFTGLFALSIFCVGIAGVELSGFFPAVARPAVLRGAGGGVLIMLLALSSVALVCVALWVGLRALPWTAVVIAGGLAALLAPMGFELAPRRFWDSRGGVVIMCLVTAALLAALLRSHPL